MKFCLFVFKHKPMPCTVPWGWHRYSPDLTLSKPSLDTGPGYSFCGCTCEEATVRAHGDWVLRVYCLLTQEVQMIYANKISSGMFFGSIPHSVSVTTLLMDLFKEGSPPRSWMDGSTLLSKLKRPHRCSDVDLLPPLSACSWRRPALPDSVWAIFSQMIPRPLLSKPPWR